MFGRLSWIAAAVLLSACQDDPSAGSRQARADDPACHGQVLSAGAIRAGDNIPMNLHVQNNGRRCWWGLSMTNQSLLGSDLVNRPSHGDTILRIDQNVVEFGYLPRPGYAGSDAFLIGLPTDSGVESNLAVTVRVVP